MLDSGPPTEPQPPRPSSDARGPAAPSPAPGFDLPEPEAARWQVDRAAAVALLRFATYAAVLALPLPLLYGGVTPGRRTWLLVILLGILGTLVTARRLLDRRPRALTIATLAILSVMLVLAQFAMGVGVQGQAQGLTAILVVLGGVLAGTRAAWGLAALNLAGVALLYSAEMAGLIPGRTLTAQQPSLNRALTLGVVIACGLFAAVVLARQYLQALDDAALQRERLDGMLRIGTDWIWEQDAQGRFTFVSPSFTQRTGLQADRVLGRALWDLPDVQAPEPGWQALRRAYDDQRPLRDELLRLQAADGRRLLVAVTAEPWYSPTGKLLGWRGAGHEVTRLMEEAQRRRESEDVLLRIFDTTPDGLAVSTLDEGRFLMVNRHFAAMLGRTPEDIVGRTSLEIGYWRDAAEREPIRAELGARGQTQLRAHRLHTATGAELAVLTSAALVMLHGRAHVVTVARDVTEIERERHEIGSVLEHAPLGIALARDHVMRRVNPAFEQLLGYAPGTLAGRAAHEIFLRERDHASYLAVAAQALEPGGVERELRWPQPDGVMREVWLRGVPVDPQRPGDGVVWLAQDVAERHRAQKQLAEAKEQAESASRAKSAFLATMSHEMRTPLNGTLGMIRLARGEIADAARRDEYLRHAEASGQALAQIISDVLDLSRVEAGRLQLEHTRFDLHALAQSVHAVHLPQAQDQGLAFALVIEPGVPRLVDGDPVRVRQILVNYVGNALKFTPSGSVELRLSPCERPADAPAGAVGVRVSVTDTGIGIDDATRARLFQPFEQADTSTTRRFGGTGLGLSICRELARLMGGRVDVHSAPGQGSEFIAELPLMPSVDMPAATAPVTCDTPLAGRRILVAEDHPVNMIIAAETLRRWGAEVDEATDGAMACEQVLRARDEGRPHHAVLMDMHMPVLNGIEATRCLRQKVQAHELPIVALTAAALASEQRLALDAGMNDFVTKPIDPAQLLLALQRAWTSGDSPMNADDPRSAT
ncbi:MAG: PAS domain S-box protein [Burkholderiaceae bacterium]|nr:PAS domain S-box protein [Aquabacterium sp.]NUP85666.1 PAS domain S-box protein [Burkholderiaceae bacterium]